MSGDYAVLTGPITGTVTLPDGQEIDVTDAVVYVEDQATADRVGVRPAVAARHGERHWQ